MFVCEEKKRKETNFGVGSNCASVRDRKKVPHMSKNIWSRESMSWLVMSSQYIRNSSTVIPFAAVIFRRLAKASYNSPAKSFDSPPIPTEQKIIKVSRRVPFQ